jgi:S-formylglutathione hydrolase FrmB
MKNLIFIVGLFLFSLGGLAQQTKQGKLVIEMIFSSSLKGNPGGEDPIRRVSVYLPPDYENSDKHYPVVYFLHGFDFSDSVIFKYGHFDRLLDEAIASGRTQPAIWVLPNENNSFKGSFYTNSSLTGNWADFTARELVSYIDKKYRTIPSRNSRGLAGHSMGGYGALKLAMLYPDVFGSVYAMSPAAIAMTEDFTVFHYGFKLALEAKNKEELFKDFFATAFVAMGRTYTPNPNKPPFYCDLPVSYKGKEISLDYEVLAKWEKETPINMIGDHIKDLKSLAALKIDWGRNDDFPHIPVGSLLFSKKLESYGINHEAEMYLGDHGRFLWETNGRFYNSLFPFFGAHLQSEEKHN